MIRAETSEAQIAARSLCRRHSRSAAREAVGDLVRNELHHAGKLTDSGATVKQKFRPPNASLVITSSARAWGNLRFG